MHAYRTHTCAALTQAAVGETVRLSGWVHNKRDHGGVLFVDLRDHYGITQVVADSDSAALPVLDKLRLESVVTIEGTVKARAEAAVNPNLPTGAIEVFAREVTVQSVASDLPLIVNSAEDYPEETRLKYRFVDLRRERLHRNIVLRSNVIASLRRRMIDRGFTEFQTPILTASSPEGARDYLVPSRIHPGRFYALPQAPQMFKQLLMVAGFDRYFQIAPCFRDEDLRADRSPEFYQLDFEMSFVTQEDVFAAIEPVLAGVFEEFADFSGTKRAVTPAPFPRIPYDQAMLEFGSDKPDLRNPIRIRDVTEHFAGGSFGLFAKIAASGGVVRAERCRSRRDRRAGAGARHRPARQCRTRQCALRAGAGLLRRGPLLRWRNGLSRPAPRSRQRGSGRRGRTPGDDPHLPRPRPARAGAVGLPPLLRGAGARGRGQPRPLPRGQGPHRDGGGVAAPCARRPSRRRDGRLPADQQRSQCRCAHGRRRGGRAPPLWRHRRRDGARADGGRCQLPRRHARSCGSRVRLHRRLHGKRAWGGREPARGAALAPHRKLTTLGR
ncbi:aspartate--tRNA ligase [Leptolyngbya sp. 15MV]|nr:aspartate--tRNA ligase [Leptolyngbya sp. 15MV]